MNTREHEEYRENIGAYLLGALPQLEVEVFERHLASCAECREEIEELRVAADALPRSVQPLEPPPQLKATIMEVVEREAAERQQATPRRRLRPAWLRLPSPARVSPAAAWVGAALLLALGVAVGWGLGTSGGGDDDRTVVAQLDANRLPSAKGDLVEGEDGATLQLEGMPPLEPGQVMQVWLERGEEIVPSTVFTVRSDGTAVAAIPDDLDGVSRVMATREPLGGSGEPSEAPSVVVEL